MCVCVFLFKFYFSVLFVISMVFFLSFFLSGLLFILHKNGFGSESLSGKAMQIFPSFDDDDEKKNASFWILFRLGNSFGFIFANRKCLNLNNMYVDARLIIFDRMTWNKRLDVRCCAATIQQTTHKSRTFEQNTTKLSDSVLFAIVRIKRK